MQGCDGNMRSISAGLTISQALVGRTNLPQTMSSTRS